MRTPLEIIAELKHVTYWSQPNLKFNETIALLNELETTLSPVEEIIDEIIAKTVEEVVDPQIIIEEPVTEIPTVKKPVTKKTTPKK